MPAWTVVAKNLAAAKTWLGDAENKSTNAAEIEGLILSLATIWELRVRAD